MSDDFDVAVLGGGVAGSAAAIAAARRGARVCIVTGPPGATALFSGAWRGACPEGLRAELAQCGYELQVCAHPLPHPTGALAGCDWTQRAHHASSLVDGAVVVGVSGLSGFEAPALARLWSDRAGVELRAASVTVAGTPSAGWSPVSLAALLDRDAGVLAQPLVQLLEQHRAPRLILPAVLGMSLGAAAYDRIREFTGDVIGEALGVPPSLPGWRLHHALRDAVKTSRAAVVEAKAVANHGNGRAQQVTLSSGDVVRARTFVLATGKFMAGGIEANGTFAEPVLGCPVWIDHLGDRFTVADTLLLTDPERMQDQALLRVGVHTDAEGRPVTAAGDVVYENVFVAGSIRAGWSINTHAIGAAAADGWAAGERAATS